ncbi:Rapid ALkalinization Factor [Quillaja saponaria]|uniref:Rapid ALkalinization Factor n=1 Tax=Quillaja saponaria TaxID=32244 RepID=A0AAD7Q1V8_QUISA|nr:Rapid ALkalinization Factor [Quillaja saponaria]
MAKSYSLALVVICSTILLLCSSTTVYAGGDLHNHLGWIPTRSPCKGSIAECLEGDEFELDSEINRRILATNQYISYGALQRNSIPCSRRGASYYNCKPGAQANPYNRGCSAITRCRS